MYGLKQAAILVYNNLQANLKPFGYVPVIGTVGLYKHESQLTIFCLCVDDFGIKYNNTRNTQHLLNAIGIKYKCTCNWTGSNYCGLTLEWHYELGYIDISMPRYVKNTVETPIYTKSISAILATCA